MSETAPLVRLDIASGVATTTLDSAHDRNAMSRALIVQLASALQATHEGPSGLSQFVDCLECDVCPRATFSRMLSAVAFLAPREAGYVTGVVLPVDGGISI